MVIGKRNKPRQRTLWIATTEIIPRRGHPFCERLNRLLDKDGFDAWREHECAPYIATKGRPSIPPGVYFRMLFIGYLEGLPSERSIAWQCADRLSLREFLGYQLQESTPDHSSLSIWRQRLLQDFFQHAFQHIIKLVDLQGLVHAFATGVDSSTVAANAVLRRLVRKENGASYREYIKELMRAAGENPDDTAALIRFDRKRKNKKFSNTEWQSETDPAARIAKMKDGTTHLAYKPARGVDLSTGAMLAVTFYPADQGDTEDLENTLKLIKNNLAPLGDKEANVFCVVTDKGYHKAELLKQLHHEHALATYIPERASSKRRTWHGDTETCGMFHANRRRTWSRAGKRLGRLRTQLVERSFALFKQSDNLSRMTVRGLANVNKRYLAHGMAYNLALVMRALFGHGTPKGLADALITAMKTGFGVFLILIGHFPSILAPSGKMLLEIWPAYRGIFSTGC